MSQYLVLIYSDPQAWAEGGQGLVDEVMKAHNDFGHTFGPKLAGGEALQGPETATTVRPGSGDSFTVTDGPFAETKEVLGGYYLIEATDLDEAIAMAKHIPAPGGGLEIRPIRVFD